ncbi:hypothetical protein IE81DRAFT_220068 [Ceraceosorus guamensis]|uniref:Uncharacterized protein n=1 Tax=Ceraceosorus guamensis TaxID=1522189 RepID=A0A316VS95_9BASI|nr:hypothetical protein IE81DRAFT_220068 [Ceraceosorus guamensis]PWN40467.1 hypothetical protein IE81DRAFT_220068 [Ceraceosorus guamensis]
MATPPAHSFTPEQLAALTVEAARHGTPISYVSCLCLGLILGDWFGALDFDFALLKESGARTLRRRKAAIAYFVARSCGAIGVGFFVVMVSVGDRKTEVCNVLIRFAPVFNGFATSASQFLFIGRVVALWPNPSVKWVTMAAWIIASLSWISQEVATENRQNPFGLLQCYLPRLSGLAQVPYCFAAAYDILIFTLTLLGFHRQGKLNVFRRGPTDSKIVHRLFITTLIFFFIIIGFHIGVIIGFWTSTTPYDTVVMAPVHTAVSVVLSCHLFMNLRQLASGTSPAQGSGSGQGIVSNGSDRRRGSRAQYAGVADDPESGRGGIRLQTTVSRRSQFASPPVLSEPTKAFTWANTTHWSGPISLTTEITPPSLSSSRPFAESSIEAHGWTKEPQ